MNAESVAVDFGRSDVKCVYVVFVLFFLAVPSTPRSSVRATAETTPAAPHSEKRAVAGAFQEEHVKLWVLRFSMR